MKPKLLSRTQKPRQNQQNHNYPSMENLLSKSAALFLSLLLTFSLLHLPITTAKLTEQELDAAISALRSHGYTLFPNAIATSDLRLRLLSSSPPNSTFTLFSPPDPLLFSLDLSSTATHYTRSLLSHVSPCRLSTSDLRNGRPYIDTLSPRHRLLIDKTYVLVNGTVSDSVLLDRVRVSVPDLFLGSAIAAHGLDGILGAGFSPDHFRSPIIWSEWNSPSDIVTTGKYGHRRENQRFHGGLGRDGGGVAHAHGNFAKFNHRLGL